MKHDDTIHTLSLLLHNVQNHTKLKLNSKLFKDASIWWTCEEKQGKDKPPIQVVVLSWWGMGMYQERRPWDGNESWQGSEVLVICCCLSWGWEHRLCFVFLNTLHILFHVHKNNVNISPRDWLSSNDSHTKILGTGGSRLHTCGSSCDGHSWPKLP